MARVRSPNRDKSKEIYLNSNGDIKLIDIAKDLNIKDSQVRKWKSQDKWDEELKGALPISKSNVTNQSNKKFNKKVESKEPIEHEVKEVLENAELTDKQRLFCIYYIKCFNATKAYKKAYECDYMTANTNGPRLLVNACIKTEIERLKEGKLNRLMLKEEDIFQRYMDIAFSDITDYVSFGQEEVPVMGPFGPLEVEGEKVTKVINSVKFKESDKVDGTIVSEVRQGKDGASIKLHDKMKALQWLTDHMNIATDKQKAEVERIKAQTNKLTGDNQEIEDTGDVESEIYGD